MARSSTNLESDLCHLLTLPNELQTQICCLDAEIFSKYHVLSFGAATSTHYTWELRKSQTWTQWRQDGRLWIKRRFEAGELLEFKQWNVKGVLVYHCFFKDGKKDGECKIWRPDGKLAYRYYLQAGKKHGEYAEWYENGKIHYHMFYERGMMHGQYKEWHKVDEHGKGVRLRVHSCYRGGLLDGEHREWYPNGQLALHCRYKDHKKEGACREWREDGQILRYLFYKDGKIFPF